MAQYIIPGTIYFSRVPGSLDELVAGSEANGPDVERLRQLTRYLATFQAVRDWPCFWRSDDVYEKDEITQAAKEACERLLLQPIEEGTAIT